MAKRLFETGDWPCYNGLLGWNNEYIYSSRAGQIWKAKVPGNIPPYCIGSRGSPFPKVAVLKLKPNGVDYTGPYSESHRNKHNWIFTLEHGKQHIRFDGNSYRLRWERATVTEYLLMAVF
jgi:hypothetical protein